MGMVDRELAGRPVEQRPTVEIESWQDWLRLIPKFENYAKKHINFWTWVWGIERGIKPPPFVGVWGRGAGKSTSAEHAVACLGARGKRKYALYVRATQDQADKSVQNIAAILERSQIGMYYPDAAERSIGKFGHARGWTRQSLRARNGFNVDAIGLDVAVRGVKIEDARPDLIIFDDIDEAGDTEKITKSKIQTISRSILPSGSVDSAILCIQNLIIRDGIFARLVHNTADILTNRIMDGPYPAVHDLEYKLIDGKAMITNGYADWDGQNLQTCQAQMIEWGLSAFLIEAQHEVELEVSGTFTEVSFTLCNPDDVPPLRQIICMIDPATTNTKRSDYQAIQIDGIEDVRRNPRTYRLYSWEGKSSPEFVIRKALISCMGYKASTIVMETNQGGDLWKSSYKRITDEMLERGEIAYRPAFETVHVNVDKAARAAPMLLAYERNSIIHVEGTHIVLEKALRRFPHVPPDDLFDAATGAWAYLSRKHKNHSSAGRLTSDLATRIGL
jgi:hypothetical protein